MEEFKRQKAFLEEKKDAVEEKKDAVQENPAKRPRWRNLHAAPETAKKEQDDAAAAPDKGKQEQHDPPAAEHAESHGSLSQDTLRMGAGSPVVQDTDEA